MCLQSKLKNVMKSVLHLHMGTIRIKLPIRNVKKQSQGYWHRLPTLARIADEHPSLMAVVLLSHFLFSITHSLK